MGNRLSVNTEIQDMGQRQWASALSIGCFHAIRFMIWIIHSE
jgi:hypothetical protein